MTPSRKNWAMHLAALFAVAILLRVVFNSGLVGSDDLAYSKNAHTLISGSFEPAASPLSNRIGFIALVALSFKTFGVSAVSLTLPCLLFSLAHMLAAFFFFYQIGRPKEGLISAWVLCLIPWEILFSGRGYPDLPSSVMFALFVVLIYPGIRKGAGVGPARAFAAGIALGVGYLIKEMVLFQMIFWTPILAWSWLSKRTLSFKAVAFSLAGACLPLVLEVAWYFEKTGNPFFRFTAIGVGYNESVWSGVGLYGLNLFERVFLVAPRALTMDSTFLLLFSLSPIAYLLLLRKTDKALGPIFGWLVFDLLFFTAGTTSLSEFNPLPLFRRYMLVMAFPAALLAGAAIHRLARMVHNQSDKKAAGLFLGISAVVLGVAGFTNSDPLLIIGAALGLCAATALWLAKIRVSRIAWIGAACAILISGLLTAWSVKFENAGPEKTLYEFVRMRSEPVFSDAKTNDILSFFDGYENANRYRSFEPWPNNEQGVLIVINEPRIAFLMKYYGFAMPAPLKMAIKEAGKPIAVFGSEKPGLRIFVFKSLEIEPANQ